MNDNELINDFKSISARVKYTAVPVVVKLRKKQQQTNTDDDSEPSQLKIMLNELGAGSLVPQPGINNESTPIHAIIDMIRPPFEAIKDKKGYIYDAATIAIKCDKQHRHRYFIRDIQSGTLACTTCNHGTKTAKKIRETFEETLKVPFVASTKLADEKLYVYTHPPLMITVEYIPQEIPSNCEQLIPKGIKITIGKCASVTKIKSYIGKFLIDYPYLSPAQKSVVSKLVPKEKKLKRRVPVVHEPLPFIDAVADNSPLIIKRQMHVLNDSRLCIENT